MKLGSFIRVIKTNKIDSVPIISTLPHGSGEDSIQSEVGSIKMESLFCKASPPSAMVQSVILNELDQTKTKKIIGALFGPLVQTQTRQTKWAFIYQLFGEVPKLRLQEYGELYRAVMEFGRPRRSDLFLLCNGKTLARLQRETDFSPCYFSPREEIGDYIKYSGGLRGIPVICHYAVPDDEILAGLYYKDNAEHCGLVAAEGEPIITVTEKYVTVECKFGHTFVSDGAKYYRRLLIEPGNYLFYQQIINRIKTTFKRSK